MTSTSIGRLVAAIGLLWFVACGSTASTGAGVVPDPMGAGLDAPAATFSMTPTTAARAGVARGAASRAGAMPAAGSDAAVAASPGAARRPERGPISVGILHVNNDAAASAGVDNGNTFSPRTAFEAFVAAFNDRGGFAGRTIEPVYVEVRSSSVTLQADLQAACSTFTQDNDVAVVLSSVGLFSETFSACLAAAGTPQIAGDYALGDAESLDVASTFYAPATMTVDDRMRALLERTTAAGRLTPDDRIGVVVEACPFNVRAHERTVVPVAERLNLAIVDRVDARCFEGANDIGGLASDMASAVLRFRSSGVSTVVFVSGSVEGNLMLFFGAAAESQGYRPGYALTSASAPAVQEANTPASQLANAFGLGWLPALDTSRPQPLLAAAQRCVADLEAGAGVTPTSPADRYFAFSICDTFGLTAAALERTAGATDVAAVAAAIGTLGAGFEAAAVHGEVTDFAGGRRTGPAQGRLFAWSAACACFEYAGPPFGLA